jgi:DNA-binding NarL/FixJ family response regulator
VSRADLLVTAGRIDEAAPVITALGPADSWRPPPHVVLLVWALGLDVALALGKSEDVVAIRDRLDRYRGHHVTCGLVAASFHGPVELWLGKASRFLGRMDVAIADLDEAVRRCARSGQRGFLVESQVELAAALLARGTPEDVTRARDVLTAAAPEAARLGMTPWSQRIAELTPALDGERGGPLSRREREIAELVAEGLTNRQIAERLFLSERTAQNHVQHILDKLGLNNRSQIAVWIERRRVESAPSGPN